MAAEYQLKLPAKTLENAEPQARAVLEKAQQQVGFIPNMYARMVNLPGLLDTYLHGYQQFREQASLTPVEQEVVLLTISRENGCHYCVAAHSMLADNVAKVPLEVIEAIRNDQPIADAKLAALHAFTRTLVASRGLPKREAVEAFLAAGFSEQQILEIVLAIAVKTLSNYSNHLFHTPVDTMFEPYAWQPTER